jgi:hypothetical protein
MAENRQISYINKDFGELRSSLIDYTRTYFPNTYSDFSTASPGMMFMEMASYVGDVLSFYLDNQIQENFLQYAKQQNNLYALAYMMGYKPKATAAAITSIEVFQQVPSILSGSTYVPDYSFALYASGGLQLSSDLYNKSNFLIQDSIDFSYSSSYDPTVTSVYQINAGIPEYFLIKKTRQAISANVQTTTFSFGIPQQFPTVYINTSNIIKILDIVDSDGNTWYEVPYLAQETIFDSIKNTNINNPNLSDDNDTPYLLQLRKEPRRFVTRFLDNNTLQIQFGAGTNTANVDEEIIPNPDNVGLGLPYKQSKLNTAFAPANFLYTDTYGIAPSNTTLTVRYLTGGGVTSNIESNTISNVVNKSTYFKFQNTTLDATQAQYIYNSISVNNPYAATGGQDGDTNEEIKIKSSTSFTTQLRSVTQDDYLVRALSMPSEYGSVAKMYIESEKIANVLPGETPAVLNLYVLAFNASKKLKTASVALKQNLSTYLSQYRVINDSLKIKDAFAVNIKVDFDIIVLPNYNNNDVINKCISSLKTYFNIDNWQINEPILISDLYVMLSQIDGVQSVKDIKISNVSNGLYSQYAYDIVGATRNGVIYPSIDPMVFEVKYPDTDIRGRVVPL